MCHGNCNQGRNCTCSISDEPRPRMTRGEAWLTVGIFLASAALVVGGAYLLMERVFP